MAFGGELQANTAVDLMVGPFVDEDDGKTAETGLTITQAEVRLSKNGANMAQKNEATSLTHDELGNYVCKLDTTDTNTEGILTLMIQESGALPIKMDYHILAQAAWISKFTAKDTGFMGVDTVAISTDTTAADNLELFTEVLENGTGLIDSGTFKAGAITAAAIAAAAIDNATFAADVGSTAYATNIIALAVRKALDEINLDHLVAVDTTVAAAGDLTTYVVDGSILSHIMSNSNTSDYKSSEDSLNKIRDDRTLAAADYVVVGDTLARVTLTDTVTTYTGNTKQTADHTANIASILADTGTDGVKIGADALGAANIADDAFSAEHFATDSITTDAMKADALDKIVMSDLATGAPSATASLPVALNWIYESFRNKTLTTATLITIKKDDGATDLAKATISDDATTFTKEEFVSG